MKEPEEESPEEESPAFAPEPMDANDAEDSPEPEEAEESHGAAVLLCYLGNTRRVSPGISPGIHILRQVASVAECRFVDFG